MTLLKNTLFDTKLGMRAAKKIHQVSDILDIGSGIRPFKLFNCHHLCIEPHDEYVSELRAHGYPVIHATALEGLKAIEPVESIFLLDVIEHMEKEEGKKVIELAKEKSKDQVIIFTPYGFMPQHTEKEDPWGYQGMYWQEHRSGWLPEDFPGWDIMIDMRFHTSKKHGAFFAIYHHPVLE